MMTTAGRQLLGDIFYQNKEFVTSVILYELFISYVLYIKLIFKTLNPSTRKIAQLILLHIIYQFKSCDI